MSGIVSLHHTIIHNPDYLDLKPRIHYFFDDFQNLQDVAWILINSHNSCSVFWQTNYNKHKNMKIIQQHEELERTSNFH